jgi:hypothetical protein
MMSFGKEKFERKKDMCPLKQEIIKYLFDFVSRKGYSQWWQYKGEFKYQGETYNLECQVKFDNQMFTYKNLYIEKRQIIVDVDDMRARGMLDD